MSFFDFDFAFLGTKINISTTKGTNKNAKPTSKNDILFLL